MPKKKGPKMVPQQNPVLAGDCFRTFLDEAVSIGNECRARREFDADVVEYLQHKGLFDDWAKWREVKRG